MKLTVKIKSHIPCLCNRGIGFDKHLLLENEYDLTDFLSYPSMVTFSLYDVKGWISDYVVERKLFFDNSEGVFDLGIRDGKDKKIKI